MTNDEAPPTPRPRYPARIKAPKVECRENEAVAACLTDRLPLLQALTSMPGFGVKTAAQILLAAGDLSALRTSEYLAAYAGIAPVPRRSGASIRGEFPYKAGNKREKNALFHSAWAAASCHEPLSKAYCDRKRAASKHHNVTLIYLAPRRLNVLFAMVNHGDFHEQKNPAVA